MSEEEFRKDLKEIRDGVADIRLEVEKVRQQTSRVEPVEKCVERIQYSLNGNGTPGLKTRLDRLENLTRTMTKALWLLFASIVGLAAKALTALFS